jgi:hypothetical protein
MHITSLEDLESQLAALREPLRGPVDPRLEEARSDLWHLDGSALAADLAKDLERSFVQWQTHAKLPLAAVRFAFAGQELAPWVATEAMASGYGELIQRDGDRPRFRSPAFDCLGGFSLSSITGTLAELGDDSEISDLPDFSSLRDALHALCLVAAARALDLACRSEAFAAVPRGEALVFLAARHDEDPVAIWAVAGPR